MTYNFDVDGWFERHELHLEKLRDEGRLDEVAFEQAMAELELRRDELWRRLDGSYRIPDGPLDARPLEDPRRRPDEGDPMDSHLRDWTEGRVAALREALAKRGISSSVAIDGDEATRIVSERIEPGSSVYRCGSVSTASIGLWERLKERGDLEVIDPYDSSGSPRLDGATPIEDRRRGLLADVMVTSCNAITRDGRIVNLDGLGNRVAALSFGPKRVILVVGRNKIVANLDAAMERVRNLAAPVNAARIGVATPCRETGRCMDCRSPERICFAWSILEGQRDRDRMHVVLVDADLGY